MTNLTKRTIQVGITFGAIVGLIGCNESADDFSMSQSAAVESENGLSMNGLSMNGLSMNGLSMNGLSMNGLSMNGLSMNGLSSTSGLMTTDGGREIVQYMVKCAYPAGHSLTKQDQNGNTWTFPGLIGIAPELENGTCNVDCQERVSACMLAHVNNSGAHIGIWLAGPDAGIGWGSSPAYPYQEGAFFGNLISSPWQGYFCVGKDMGSGEVPGRLGTPIATNVYTNPYGTNVPCKNACTVTNEGYTSCTDYSPIAPNTAGHKWNHVVTVWRNFEATQAYKICTKQTPVRCLGVVGSSTAEGANVEQRTYSGATSQQWQILQVEAGKYKFQNIASGKVIDVNGTQIVQRAYTGASTQKIPVAYFADQAGWANLKPGAGSAAIAGTDGVPEGALMKMSTNLSPDYAKWGFTAVGVAPTTDDGSTGTTTTTGAAGSSGTTTGAAGSSGTTTGAAGSSGTTSSGFTAGANYRIAPVTGNGGVSFDIPGGATANGTMMQVYTTTGGNNNQRMQFVATGSNYKIVPGIATNKCFDVGTANGSLVVLNDCNGGSSQTWTATFDSATSAYTFRNAASGRCLDMPNNSVANGTRPQIYDCWNSNSQKFLIPTF
jgi:hypothetical protein